MTKSTTKQLENQIDKIIKTAQHQIADPNVEKHIKKSLSHSKRKLIKKSLIAKKILGKNILRNPYPYIAASLVAATTMGFLINKKLHEKEKGFFERLFHR